jgi:hypothetical protein
MGYAIDNWLVLVAYGYYVLVGFKILGQLWRVKLNMRKFYDDRMSTIFGIFIIIHVIAAVIFLFNLVIQGMVHAAL